MPPCVSVKAEIEAASTETLKAHDFVTNITDQASMEKLFPRIVNTIPSIDVYIANVAYLSMFGPVATSSIEDFWQGLRSMSKAL